MHVYVPACGHVTHRPGLSSLPFLWLACTDRITGCSPCTAEPTACAPITACRYFTYEHMHARTHRHRLWHTTSLCFSAAFTCVPALRWLRQDERGRPGTNSPPEWEGVRERKRERERERLCVFPLLNPILPSPGRDRNEAVCFGIVLFFPPLLLLPFFLHPSRYCRSPGFQRPVVILWK